MPKKHRPKKQITSERLQQLGFAYAPPLIISAAVSNKVFDALESGAKTVEQVSKETGASVRGLRAVMDALVGLDLLKKDPKKKYSLTPESEAFLISNKPGTVAGFFGSILPQLNSRWPRLSDAVREGRSVRFRGGRFVASQFLQRLRYRYARPYFAQRRRTTKPPVAQENLWRVETGRHNRRR